MRTREEVERYARASSDSDFASSSDGLNLLQLEILLDLRDQNERMLILLERIQLGDQRKIAVQVVRDLITRSVGGI